MELRAEAWLQASHRLFAIVDGETSEIPVARGYANGLIEPVRKGACVATGIRSGGVHVTILIRDDPAGSVEDGWDEVAEVSVRSRKGDLNVRSIDDWPDLPTLSLAGSGTYRIRAHARGRDDDPHGSVSRSTEFYRFESWPAPAAEPLLLRHTDARGEELRRA
ncbi:hypothetical protein [Actinoplanes utahensis]|uniref:hypothetical protein n=1 Tax=Actinoplanes utahensis TaxID=1869 RepID=UPI00068CA0B3|nr:hypothetical protein [Actinoplanes utahensis]GIF30439.1 hypothetical protein Aut01nite_34250 [Actinoplanes utahensis]